MSHWRLSAASYLPERPAASWVNRAACAPPNVARFADKYDGPDRSFAALSGRPLFQISERERRPLGLRPIQPMLPYSNAGLNPCFLIAEDFSELLDANAPGELISTVCDIRHHRKDAEPSGYRLGDFARVLDAFDVVDRANSRMAIQVSIVDGRRVHAIDLGKARFEAATVQGLGCFRLKLGWKGTQLIVSDAVADAIFARQIPGLVLEDVGGVREAPALYQPYNRDGWALVYPA